MRQGSDSFRFQVGGFENVNVVFPSGIRDPDLRTRKLLADKIGSDAHAAVPPGVCTTANRA